MIGLGWAGTVRAALEIDPAMESLSAQLADQIAGSQLRKVGVLEFLNNSPTGEKLSGDTGSAGRYAAEKIEEGLVNCARGRFAVVERRQLDAVVKEVKLQVSDLVKTEPLKKVWGQIEGLDGVVLGTLTRMGKEVKVTVKVIEPRTAINRVMESTSVAITPDLGALFGESVFVPPRLEGEPPTPAEVVAAFSPPLGTKAPRVHPLADPLSTMPYSVRIWVDGRAVEPIFKGREMVVGVAPGTQYAIELGNHSDKTVAVSLLIDGLNSIGQERVLPSEGRKWVLAAGKRAVIRGWQIDNRMAREFVFVGAQDSLAYRKGFYEDIGLITACFYPEKAQGGPSVRGVVGTGEGAEIKSHVREVNLIHEPAPAAIINIRYDLPQGIGSQRE